MDALAEVVEISARLFVHRADMDELRHISETSGLPIDLLIRTAVHEFLEQRRDERAAAESARIVAARLAAELGRGDE